MVNSIHAQVMNAYHGVKESVGNDIAMRAARKQYGDRALNPGLFSALEEGTRRQEAHEQDMSIAQSRENRAQGTYDFEMESAQTDKRQEAMLNLVEGLRVARDRGDDMGDAFDSLADTLPALGVAAEDIPALREELVKNPAILDDYYEALKANNGGRGTAASYKQQQEEAKQDEGRRTVTELTNELRETYNALDEGGGIIAEDAGSIFNKVSRWVSTTYAGRLTGQIAGTKNERLRQDAEGARQLLLLAVKNATGMSARQMDSNVELQAMLNAATDPGRSLEANLNALDRLNKLYGLEDGGGGDAERDTSGEMKAGDIIETPSGKKVEYLGGDPNSRDSYRVVE